MVWCNDIINDAKDIHKPFTYMGILHYKSKMKKKCLVIGENNILLFWARFEMIVINLKSDPFSVQIF